MMNLDDDDITVLFNIVRAHLRGPSPDLSAYQLAHRLEEHLEDISADGNPKTAVGQNELHDWATVAEAARLLDCSERRVRQIAPAVGGRKRGGTWWIPRSSLPED